jgi:hypothetical protein
VTTIGFESDEICFGAARDFEVERLGDAIRSERVDFGREAAEQLARRARRQRRGFQDG